LFCSLRWRDLCLVLADEVVAVLAVGVEVAILAVGGGFEFWTTGVFVSGVGHGCRFEAEV
jgi:hypothetical protein